MVGLGTHSSGFAHDGGCLGFVIFNRASNHMVGLDGIGIVVLDCLSAQTNFALGGICVGYFGDVQQASRMGEHALMYVWLVYGMRLLAPRLQFSSVFVHALYATAMVFVIQLLRALAYLVLLGSHTQIYPMLWLLLAIPAWLLLAVVLTRGIQSRKMGEWMTN